MKPLSLVCSLGLLLSLCSCGKDAEPAPKAKPVEKLDKVISGSAGSKLQALSFGLFNDPWAMTFLPDGKLLLTERGGSLLLLDLEKGSRASVKGVPEVAYGGQGGLGDIILHPQYKDNQLVYLSYIEENMFGRRRGAIVVRAKLNTDSSTPALENMEVIWKQIPQHKGKGHFSHRLVFSPDGHLFITSGDRRHQAQVQSWEHSMGKIIRLKDDGSVPKDNPFQDKGELAKTFWTLGHRNALGIAFDRQGKLWAHEMGPQHGDEFNRIIAGQNYGWPIVSWGDQYSGVTIPNHDTRPEFHAPAIYWVPSIAPSGLMIYKHSLFPQWQGNAFITGLQSKSLIRIKIDGDKAEEVEQFPIDSRRLREVEQGPKGAIWVLEDRKNARLIRLTPEAGK